MPGYINNLHKDADVVVISGAVFVRTNNDQVIFGEKTFTANIRADTVTGYFNDLFIDGWSLTGATGNTIQKVEYAPSYDFEGTEPVVKNLLSLDSGGAAWLSVHNPNASGDVHTVTLDSIAVGVVGFTVNGNVVSVTSVLNDDIGNAADLTVALNALALAGTTFTSTEEINEIQTITLSSIAAGDVSVTVNATWTPTITSTAAGDDVDAVALAAELDALGINNATFLANNAVITVSAPDGTVVLTDGTSTGGGTVSFATVPPASGAEITIVSPLNFITLTAPVASGGGTVTLGAASSAPAFLWKTIGGTTTSGGGGSTDPSAPGAGSITISGYGDVGDGVGAGTGYKNAPALDFEIGPNSLEMIRPIGENPRVRIGTHIKASSHELIINWDIPEGFKKGKVPFPAGFVVSGENMNPEDYVPPTIFTQLVWTGAGNDVPTYNSIVREISHTGFTVELSAETEEPYHSMNILVKTNKSVDVVAIPELPEGWDWYILTQAELNALNALNQLDPNTVYYTTDTNRMYILNQNGELVYYQGQPV
jgi:hypothetical protein